MFFLLSSKFKISEGIIDLILKDFDIVLDFYPNSINSKFFDGHNLFIKWTDISNTTSKIFANEKGLVLEEGLCSYKGNLDDEKLNILLDDFFDGKEIIRNLDNHFNLIIYDFNNKEITYINDIIGSQHSFIYSGKNFVVISSSLAIISFFTKRDFNNLALNEFLTLGNVYEDRTIFNEIKRISGAKLIIIKEGSILLEKVYWNGLDEYRTNRLKIKEAVDQVDSAISKVINRLKTFNGTVVSDLTGGFDSRLILLYLLKSEIEAIYSFSGGKTKDYLIAKDIAESLKLKFIYLDDTYKKNEIEQLLPLLAFITNGSMSILPYYSSYFSHSYFSKNRGIHITGTGGELLRWDWPKYEGLFAGLRKTVNKRLIVQSRFNSELISREYFSSLINYPLTNHFYEMLAKIEKTYFDHTNVQKADFMWIVLRLQCWGGSFRNANSHVQPIFTPFLTKEILSVAFSLHYTIKKRHRLVREMMYRMNIKLSDFDTEIGLPYQPINTKNYYKFLKFYFLKVKEINKLLNFLGYRSKSKNNPEIDDLVSKYFMEKKVYDLATGQFLSEKNFNNLLHFGRYKGSLENILLWRILTLEEFLKIHKNLPIINYIEN